MEYGRILVVDPDTDTRALYRHALEGSGHDVVEAADGRDALVKALIESPQLIITETRLPMMDGFALCEILRRDHATRSTPILVVTSEAESAKLQRARAVGADAVLAKPARLDAILAETERLIGRGELSGNGNHGRRPVMAATTTVSTDRNRESGRHMTGSRMHARFTTTAPPVPPPELHCPSCDGLLTYLNSHVGGVSSRYPEQWDYYVCAASCGAFEYRQRTRKLRHVEENFRGRSA
jgi:two-component system chemotaxis response regulator CheY